MNKLLRLFEKAPVEIKAMVEVLVSFITSAIDVEEMKNKRGADYDSTQFYQIRVKPTDVEADREALLASIEKLLKSAKAKKLQVTEVQVNERSRNSGKFSSVSFSHGGFDFDVVVAAGANKGETFEKEMLLKMDNLVSGISSSKEAQSAFDALRKVDPSFKLTSIKSVTPRSGSTQRSGDMSPEETGKIIADIIVELKNGTKKYISVKNKLGSTVAQFGISKAFTDDLKVDTTSSEWKNWVKPFGFDVAKIEEGLKAAKNGMSVPWDDIVVKTTTLRRTSPIYKIMQKMWGLNYYYLRETSSGFKALKIDKDYVDNELLANLKVTEIRYPSMNRKQMTVYLESDAMRFKVEFRNPRGKGDVRPTQIQLTIMKSAV